MMNARNYWVDWDDRFYPQIRHARYFHDPFDEFAFKTFTECKKEIVEYFQEQIRSAKEMIRHNRALTLKDLLDG